MLCALENAVHQNAILVVLKVNSVGKSPYQNPPKIIKTNGIDLRMLANPGKSRFHASEKLIA